MSKLTNEQRNKICQRRLKGETMKSLVSNFKINRSKINHLFRLIQKHGYNTLRENKNIDYSKEFKQIAIDRVLIKNESVTPVAIDRELSSE